jgi:hypothetical protein
MEDAVRQNCKDAVHDLVVVGQNRDLPVLLVETTSSLSDLNEPKKQVIVERIIQCMSGYNDGRFLWDRVDDPKRIVLLEQGSILRTVKGSTK